MSPASAANAPAGPSTTKNEPTSPSVKHEPASSLPRNAKLSDEPPILSAFLSEIQYQGRLPAEVWARVADFVPLSRPEDIQSLHHVDRQMYGDTYLRWAEAKTWTEEICPSRPNDLFDSERIQIGLAKIAHFHDETRLQALEELVHKFADAAAARADRSVSAPAQWANFAANALAVHIALDDLNIPERTRLQSLMAPVMLRAYPLLPAPRQTSDPDSGDAVLSFQQRRRKVLQTVVSRPKLTDAALTQVNQRYDRARRHTQLGLMIEGLSDERLHRVQDGRVSKWVHSGSRKVRDAVDRLPERRRNALHRQMVDVVPAMDPVSRASVVGRGLGAIAARRKPGTLVAVKERLHEMLPWVHRLSDIPGQRTRLIHYLDAMQTAFKLLRPYAVPAGLPPIDSTSSHQLLKAVEELCQEGARFADRSTMTAVLPVIDALPAYLQNSAVRCYNAIAAQHRVPPYAEVTDDAGMQQTCQRLLSTSPDVRQRFAHDLARRVLLRMAPGMPGLTRVQTQGVRSNLQRAYDLGVAPGSKPPALGLFALLSHHLTEEQQRPLLQAVLGATPVDLREARDFIETLSENDRQRHLEGLQGVLNQQLLSLVQSNAPPPRLDGAIAMLDWGQNSINSELLPLAHLLSDHNRHAVHRARIVNVENTARILQNAPTAPTAAADIKHETYRLRAAVVGLPEIEKSCGGELQVAFWAASWLMGRVAPDDAHVTALANDLFTTLERLPFEMDRHEVADSAGVQLFVQSVPASMRDLVDQRMALALHNIDLSRGAGPLCNVQEPGRVRAALDFIEHRSPELANRTHDLQRLVADILRAWPENDLSGVDIASKAIDELQQPEDALRLHAELAPLLVAGRNRRDGFTTMNKRTLERSVLHNPAGMQAAIMFIMRQPGSREWRLDALMSAMQVSSQRKRMDPVLRERLELSANVLVEALLQAPIKEAKRNGYLEKGLPLCRRPLSATAERHLAVRRLDVMADRGLRSFTANQMGGGYADLADPAAISVALAFADQMGEGVAMREQLAGRLQSLLMRPEGELRLQQEGHALATAGPQIYQALGMVSIPEHAWHMGRLAAALVAKLPIQLPEVLQFACTITTHPPALDATLNAMQGEDMFFKCTLLQNLAAAVQQQANAVMHGAAPFTEQAVRLLEHAKQRLQQAVLEHRVEVANNAITSLALPQWPLQAM